MRIFDVISAVCCAIAAILLLLGGCHVCQTDSHDMKLLHWAIGFFLISFSISVGAVLAERLHP